MTEDARTCSGAGRDRTFDLGIMSGGKAFAPVCVSARPLQFKHTRALVVHTRQVRRPNSVSNRCQRDAHPGEPYTAMASLPRATPERSTAPGSPRGNVSLISKRGPEEQDCRDEQTQSPYRPQDNGTNALIARIRTSQVHREDDVDNESDEKHRARNTQGKGVR